MAYKGDNGREAIINADTERVVVYIYMASSRLVGRTWYRSCSTEVRLFEKGATQFTDQEKLCIHR